MIHLILIFSIERKNLIVNFIRLNPDPVRFAGGRIRHFFRLPDPFFFSLDGRIRNPGEHLSTGCCWQKHRGEADGAHRTPLSFYTHQIELSVRRSSGKGFGRFIVCPVSETFGDYISKFSQIW